MLKITDIKFSDTMILNGGKFILVSLSPIYTEEAKSEGESLRAGTKMVVALSAHQLKKIEVIVEDSVVCSSFNELQLAEVSFSDFIGRFVFQEKLADYKFTATASRFKLIQD